jgi:hypothetical protein
MEGDHAAFATRSSFLNQSIGNAFRDLSLLLGSAALQTLI